MKRGLKLLIVLFLTLGGAVILARFFNENTEDLQLQFMDWRTKPLGKGHLVGLAFLMGMLVSTLLMFSTVISRSLQASRLKRENEALQRLIASKQQEAHSSSSKT